LHTSKKRRNVYRSLLHIVQHYKPFGEEPQTENLRGYVSKCRTSTLLAFSKPKSSILACVLEQYENPSFLLCLRRDRLLGGAQCVKSTFELCFKQHNRCNDMTVGDKDTRSDICMSSSNSESDKILELFGRNPHRATHVRINVAL
jgi:hypothetical protein